MGLTINGEGGRLKSGWHVAAVLGKWTAMGAPDHYGLVFHAVSKDPFWITQPITDVELPVCGQTWIWRGIALDGRAGALTLPGKPERRKA